MKFMEYLHQKRFGIIGGLIGATVLSSLSYLLDFLVKLFGL